MSTAPLPGRVSPLIDMISNEQYLSLA
jgi:hypothetical protein